MPLSTKNLTIGIVIGLVIGLVSGYALTPKGDTVDLEQRIDELEEQVSNLQTAIDNKDAQTSNLQAQLDDKNTQITSLQAQISDKDVRITSLQSQVSERDSQIADLLAQLDELQGTVPPLRNGEWNLVATFDGQGEYTTDYFHIPDLGDVELRINWTNHEYDSDKWISWIYLYHKGDEWYYESLQVPKTKTGSWLIHPPLETGYSYLEIDTWIYSESEWTVNVEVWIPE